MSELGGILKSEMLNRPTTAVCCPDGSLLIVDNAAFALYFIQGEGRARRRMSPPC
jgi:hypothetical protein